MAFVALSLLQESMIHLATAQLQSCMHAKKGGGKSCRRLRAFRNPPPLGSSTSLFILMWLAPEQAPSFSLHPHTFISLKWTLLSEADSLHYRHSVDYFPHFPFSSNPFTKAAPLHLHLSLSLRLHTPSFPALQQHSGRPAQGRQIH